MDIKNENETLTVIFHQTFMALVKASQMNHKSREVVENNGACDAKTLEMENIGELLF